MKKLLAGLILSALAASTWATVVCVCSSDAPTVATAASATPSTVTGTTTSLSVLGTDDGGEAILIYTWEKICGSVVSFSVNATNAAKNCVATFANAGSYILRVSIKDAQNQIVNSNVGVTVNQTLTSISVSPSSVSLSVNATQQFAASSKDQFNIAMSPQPTITWSVSSGGTINASGRFTAGSTPTSCTVTATSGPKFGTANVVIH
jgi:hypothetical protein